MKLKQYKKITKTLAGETILLDVLNQALPLLEGSLLHEHLSAHLSSDKPLSEFFTAFPNNGAFLSIDSLTSSTLTIIIGEDVTNCEEFPHVGIISKLLQKMRPSYGGVGESFTINYNINESGDFIISNDSMIQSLLDQLTTQKENHTLRSVFVMNKSNLTIRAYSFDGA